MLPMMPAKQEENFSLGELYGRVYETWGTGPEPYGLLHTPESFTKLPEAKQVSLLDAIASLNPGYWAEEVLGRPVQITEVVPLINIHGKDIGLSIVKANIPRAKVRISSGEIKI